MEEAREYWEGDPQTAKRLARLADKGWLERLERGKYLIVPLEAGPERQWVEDSYILAGNLVQPAAVAYWSALHYWNLTEQVPRMAYVQTTADLREHTKTVLGIRFRFVKLKHDKLFGLAQERSGGKRFRVTNREKTLLDGLDRLDLTGGIHEIAKALRQEGAEFDWDRIEEYLARLDVGAVIKRLGFLVETLDIPVPDREGRLNRWQERISAGISKLDPSSSRDEGRIVTRWGVRVNVEESSLRGMQ